MQVRDNVRLHPYILVLPVYKSCLKVQVCLDPDPISFDCNFIIKYFKRIEYVKPQTILNGLNMSNHKFIEFVVRNLIFYNCQLIGNNKLNL